MKSNGSFVMALALWACVAGAQESWPSRPLKMVVPYPPGALTDTLARAVTERLSPALGQPIVVENKPGAGTLLAAEQVKNAPAAGYTLIMVTSTTLGISPALYKKPAIDPVKDFAPVSPIAATVPGFDGQAWQGVAVAGGTPRAIVQRLNAEMQKFQNTAEFRALLAKFGMDPSPPNSAEQFADPVRKDAVRWAEAVRVSGAKVD